CGRLAKVPTGWSHWKTRGRRSGKLTIRRGGWSGLRGGDKKVTKRKAAFRPLLPLRRCRKMHFSRSYGHPTIKMSTFIARPCSSFAACDTVLAYAQLRGAFGEIRTGS